jgi:tight adherence protein B
VDPQLTLLAVFAAVALVLFAVAMLLRDVFFGGNAANDLASAALGRLPHYDEFPPRGPIARVDYLLNQLAAGTGHALTPLAAVMLMLLCGLAAGGGIFVWRENPYMALGGFVAGVLIALVGLLIVRARRVKAIHEQLPDVIELLARAVRAGESIDQALALAAETTPLPLGPELRRCSGQLALGLSLSAAMRGVTRRVPVTEVRMLTAALVVQQQAGGSLPLTLERLSRVVRDRISYYRQLSASTGASRMGTILVTLAGPFVALYLFIWQHDYLARFWNLPHGLWLLGLAGVLEVIGIFWATRVLKSQF